MRPWAGYVSLMLMLMLMLMAISIAMMCEYGCTAEKIVLCCSYGVNVNVDLDGILN